MVYPASPFTNKFGVSTIFNLNSPTTTAATVNLNHLLSWLCLPPKITTIRVNTLKSTVATARRLTESVLTRLANEYNKSIPRIEIHPLLPYVLLISPYPATELDLKPRLNEIVVDAACGAAVLRGSNVYAPGVMGMLAGAKLGDLVSVYADISRNCTRGLAKIYECPQKVFVGNGLIRMIRNQIYGDQLKPTGIAVEITDSVSGCPNFNESQLKPGMILLQNIPSIICGNVLSPKQGDVILDMCAAPGNKTSHLAALLENIGTIIAIDKTPNKLKLMEETKSEFSLNCVQNYFYDSTKLYDAKLETPAAGQKYDFKNGPPFPGEIFDKILLDAPCSGLGKRPQLVNPITDKVCLSFIPLQRKLFENAVLLLKPGGILVYSTCTITVGENEGMVAWALEKFPSLQLVLASPVLGGPGWAGASLTEEQRQVVQRFGPDKQTDSIGFFIARFRKESFF